jgi:hypothetical protein
MLDSTAELTTIPKINFVPVENFLKTTYLANPLYQKRGDLMEGFIKLNKQEKGIFDPQKPDFKDHLHPFLTDEKNQIFVNEVLQNITNVKRPFPEDNAAYSDLGPGNPYQTLDEKIISWAFAKREAGPKEGETNFAAYQVIKSFYDYYQKDPNRFNQDKDTLLKFCQTAFGEKTGDVLTEFIGEIIGNKEVDIDTFQNKINSLLKQEPLPESKIPEEKPVNAEIPQPKAAPPESELPKIEQQINSPMKQESLSKPKISEKKPVNKKTSQPKATPPESVLPKKEQQKSILSPYFIEEEKAKHFVQEMKRNRELIEVSPITYENHFLPFIFYDRLITNDRVATPYYYLRTIGEKENLPEALVLYPNGEVRKIAAEGTLLTDFNSMFVIYGNSLFMISNKDKIHFEKLAPEDAIKIIEKYREKLSPQIISEINNNKPFPPSEKIPLLP